MYRAGIYPLAWALKMTNHLLFNCILSFECEIEPDLEMVHFGLGCVVHPNVKIGRRVKMYHNVTLAAESYIGSPARIVIEDDVLIGAQSVILGNEVNGIVIGKGAVIGAGAIVTGNVAPGAVMVGIAARAIA